MKVELTLKNGKTRAFHPMVAKVLEARGMGYQTREVRAVVVQESDELAKLKSEADRRGIKYHHRAGVAKLRELLEG